MLSDLRGHRAWWVGPIWSYHFEKLGYETTEKALTKCFDVHSNMTPSIAGPIRCETFNCIYRREATAEKVQRQNGGI